MKTNKIHNIVMLAIFAGLFLTVSAQAATYTVNSTADPGVGICDATECTLREAITAANATAANDVIEFDAAVFNTPQVITLVGSQLTSISNSGMLTINGRGADRLTISGNNVVTVFRNDNLTAGVVINGVTISNGRGSFGGGIANAVGCNLTLNNSVVRNNSATHTGGGFNTDGTLTLNNSTVSYNSASINGGGISNGGTISNGGGVTLNNSTVSNNSAPNGGGIDNGTFNDGSRLTLNSSTVSNNTATTGGGIRNVMPASTTTLNNSIIANSTSSPDCARLSGTINATYSLIETGLTCVNGTNSNNLTGDPNLGPLQNNGGTTETHALLSGSIAKDAGSTDLTTDQRGVSRPQGSADDIGSFEVEVVTYNFRFFYYSQLLEPRQMPYFMDARAGSDVSVSYSLGGYQGANPYSQPPRSQRINCVNKSPIGASSAIQTYPGDPFYNAQYDFYTTIWRTQSNYAGTCRRLTLYFKDGTTQSLDYRFN